MPVKVAPPVKPKQPPRIVHIAGKQEDFAELGGALSAQLGWDGPDHHLGNDITVADARAFLVKSLHEQFQAGAKGEPQPDPALVCEHLGLTDDADVAMVAAECGKSFDAGKGAVVLEQEAKVAGIAADLVVTGTTALNKLAEASGKTV
jgi:hypothetical protein